MAWPQCFDNVGAGSQYGPRTFKGKATFHWGRDQPVGVGRAFIAKARGRVVGRSWTRTYGFYLIVQYDGSSIRHHRHQMQDASRLALGATFAKGAVLGHTGDPLLHIPWERRHLYPEWSGSDASTGSHSHEELRTGVSIETAIDARSTAATAAWDAITRTQTAPAGGGATPLEGFLMALTDQQQQDMYARIMGFNVQRYDADKKPARALDSLDGNMLREMLQTIIDATKNGPSAFARIMGVLRSRTRADGKTVAAVMDELDGEQLRADIGASTTRAVGETSSAFHQLVAAIAAGKVDPATLAAALAPLLEQEARSLSDADLSAASTAIADELDRRARERLGS